MVAEIFTFITTAFTKNIFIALFAAFSWGILSILLSPCHLSSIPLIVGFMNKYEKVSTKQAFYISLMFSIGILITIALVGIITAISGRIAGDIGKTGNYIVVGIFVIIGLYLMEVINIPFFSINHSYMSRFKGGLIAALLLGVIFGVALGPCTFAYLAPMLAIIFNVSTTKFLFGVLLLLVYAVGHCSIIVFAGTFTEVVRKYLNWNENSKGVSIVKKICGCLVVLGGIYILI
jgi:cytochrome c-type biogenesis protein